MADIEKKDRPEVRKLRKGRRGRRTKEIGKEIEFKG